MSESVYIVGCVCEWLCVSFGHVSMNECECVWVCMYK